MRCFALLCIALHCFALRCIKSFSATKNAKGDFLQSRAPRQFWGFGDFGPRNQAGRPEEPGWGAEEPVPQGTGARRIPEQLTGCIGESKNPFRQSLIGDKTKYVKNI